MASTKRIILADGSRLLREMLHHVLAKAEYLEVVQELPQLAALGPAIRRFDPEWVILPLAFDQDAHNWLRSCMADFPSVRFLFLSAGQKQIRMRWQVSCEEIYPDLSLRELIQFLEKDRQHI